MIGAATAAMTVLLLEGVAAAKVGYVRSTVGAPWGQNVNEQAMDKAFGPGQWDDLRFETLVVDTVLSKTYTFLYIEGSDSNADELEAWLTTNQVKLEAWVAAGGNLFMNSAPNEGNGMSFGFGGVTLIYPGFPTNPGHAVDPLHPIWVGPNLPIATMFTGGSYAHAKLSGGTLTSLILDANNGPNPNLAERPKGNGGCTIFGGLTTSNFWNPAPESLNLRANIIKYVSSCVVVPPDTDKDGILDNVDNCVNNANPLQEDGDGDKLGDVCDTCPKDAMNDVDKDKVCGDVDNCPAAANAGQEDADMDLAGDACDVCPNDADDDVDADKVCGDVDNCPEDANPGQEDADMDGVGDVCQPIDETTGTSTGGDSSTGGSTTDELTTGTTEPATTEPATTEPATTEPVTTGEPATTTGEPGTTGGEPVTSGEQPTTGGPVTTMEPEGTSTGGGDESGSGTDTAGVDDGGCGCRSESGGGAGGWLGLALGGLLLRRRRRG